MQLPGAAPGVNRSGRTFKVSCFIPPVTLPFHHCYVKGRDTCHSFCGPTKKNYNYQGATCFWPALSLKQTPENKHKRLPGYSSQNHKLSKAVWLFSRTGANDHSDGPDKSTWALPWTHLWPCFNQRHCTEILVALTPVPTAPCLPLHCCQARMAAGYTRWQQMKNPNQMRYISGLFLIYNFFTCHCVFSLPHWNHCSNCNITSSTILLARTLFSMSDHMSFKQKVLCETNRRERFRSGSADTYTSVTHQTCAQGNWDAYFC